MSDSILTKQTQKEIKNKSAKKYKCPYCEERHVRDKLVTHIERKHSDMTSEEFTANRIVFNVINKKISGRCTECGKETPWNEDKCRYERLCSKKCKMNYAKRAEQNTGRHAQMRDPNNTVALDMVQSRKIAGNYKFENGVEIGYVGSYEKDFLEFMDKVLKVDPSDIQQPGPIIDYTYNGTAHRWLTDFYYIPFNLVIDVKDGGSNPNNRDMKEYREKQAEKEKAIQELNKYNYLRLTDKNNTQLIEIMMELKHLMIDLDKNYEVISRIHEMVMAPVMSAYKVQPYNPDNVYVVNYLQNNVFSGKDINKYALCKDYMSDIVTYDETLDEFKKVNLEDFLSIAQDMKCYRYLGEHTYKEILENSEDDIDFYQYTTGKPLLDYDQIGFDESFQECVSFPERLNIINMCIETTAYEPLDNHIVTESVVLDTPSIIMEQTDCGLSYGRDINGVFVKNENTLLRSPSYSNMDEIPKKIIEVLKSL